MDSVKGSLVDNEQLSSSSALEPPAAKMPNLGITNANDLPTTATLDPTTFDTSFDAVSFFGDDNLLGDSFGTNDDNGGASNSNALFDSLLGGAGPTSGLANVRDPNDPSVIVSARQQSQQQSNGQNLVDGSASSQGVPPTTSAADDFELDQLLEQNSNSEFPVCYCCLRRLRSAMNLIEISCTGFIAL